MPLDHKSSTSLLLTIPVNEEGNFTPTLNRVGPKQSRPEIDRPRGGCKEVPDFSNVMFQNWSLARNFFKSAPSEKLGSGEFAGVAGSLNRRIKVMEICTYFVL